MNKLYVVGIGPGEPEQMTLKAWNTLKNSDVIAGYGVYAELVRPLLPEKEYIVTPMRREAERCRLALEAALSGKTVSVISSGDAGVYGMAALMLETAAGAAVDVEIVPGVTAALSGGAVLGAPLTHDFAVISLSDLLTPWETIEKRLDMASRADLSIVLYNPSSVRRADYLRRACDILLQNISPDTVCGVVRNIGREGESTELMSLRELREYRVDMFSTVFVGNRGTKIVDGHMVTPRGYKNE